MGGGGTDEEKAHPEEEKEEEADRQGQDEKEVLETQMIRERGER